ncbi:MAG: FAD-dependent oxidoreductase, partial [Candidatus Acidiferrales bacterium]
MATALEDFCGAVRGKFKGDLIRHDNPEFAEASRIWNAMVARTPGAIARCADVADVGLIVRHAREAGILTAVRCGGHSLAGFGSCDGGLVIDLSRLRGVQVDAGSRYAKFAGGCLLGNVDRAARKFVLPPERHLIRVLQEWREFMPAAPDGLKWNISLVRASNDDRVPEEIRGKPALSSSIVWFGDEATGQRHTNRIFSVGRHVGRSMKTISYLTLQTMADSDFPHGRRYYTKSGYFA